jgi:transposase
MQLKTILNRVQKHRSFVYGTTRLVQHGRLALEVEVRPRANSRAKCSVCGRPGPGYDTLPARRFEFVPLWGMPVFFLYAMRRVACARCGVRVETVPWAQGKRQLTDTYAWFLATGAKRLDVEIVDYH